MIDSYIKKLETNMQTLEKELEAQKKTTKNALKFSIGVGIVCFFFVALNLSILFTIAGSLAVNERKVQTLQTQVENLKNKNTEHNKININNN